MNNYLYDGSFYGLLTLVFDIYSERNNIGTISSTGFQIDFVSNITEIKTDIEKAKRVEKYLKEKISNYFFSTINIAFLSCEKNKDELIVKSIFETMKKGKFEFNNPNTNCFLLQKLARAVLNERHRYLGLLRFKELEDGALFSTFEPKNNILPVIIEHFAERLGSENFAIFDKKRNMLAYYNSSKIEIFQVDKLDLKYSDKEQEYQELWKAFHKSISIDERKSKKLQQNNLPKYYWKHLVENMDE